jgi:hypothetical protein
MPFIKNIDRMLKPKNSQKTDEIMKENGIGKAYKRFREQEYDA